ncbi:MAG TPA: zf-TFIIB domain-containing protein [Polyangiaceae bacterium]|nr:zf-TFIIB domain-containing protein [Polyangiaceae bacterium]
MCGAPVAANAPRCEYCHAPLASVHCAACFALNPASALHCAGCGEKLGLEPLDLEGDAACPACHERLRAFGASSGRLSECTACGGQFVEHALLQELLERRELHRVVTRAPVPRKNPLETPVRYLKCPGCATLMNRNNFGGNSGVVVDVCPRHGVWFDPGELPRILEFVQAGGLERARQRAARERAEHERAERVSHVDLHARGPLVEAQPPAATDSLTSTLLDVLSTIGDAIDRYRHR